MHAAAHAPVDWQTAPVPHWADVTQATQAPEVRLQTGVVPPHWLLEEQATHTPVPRLQTGAALGHCELAVQAAVHWPVA